MLKVQNIKKILLATLILLSFCVPKPSFAISEREEIEIGRQSAYKVESQYGLWNDSASLDRINRIGHAIAQISDRPNLPYTFKALNTDKVNALACPGGFIYVTKGLLKDVTDDELSFVLSHEIAHAAKRHSAKQIEKDQATTTGLLILSSFLNKGRISQGSLNTVAAVSTVLSSGYSREDERDADITGCHYMVKALGANPRAAVTFMHKLKKTGGEMPEFMNSIIGDHPTTDDRIKTLEEECRKMGY